MPAVYCEDEGCVYNDGGVCRAKAVHLSRESVVTLWYGYKWFKSCKDRETPGENAEWRMYEREDRSDRR